MQLGTRIGGREARRETENRKYRFSVKFNRKLLFSAIFHFFQVSLKCVYPQFTASKNAGSRLLYFYLA